MVTVTRGKNNKKETMHSALLIETSSTRRFAMRQVLADAGAHVAECRNYWDAARLLKDKGAGAYDVIVLGWETHEPELVGLLQEELVSDGKSDTPLAVLCDEPDQVLKTWIDQRGCARVFAYESQNELMDFIRELGEPVEDLKPDVELPDLIGVEQQLASSSASHTVRLLLVDDTRSSRERYRRVLEVEGYDVTPAASVTDAVMLANRGNFDLAIIDFFLLESDDGALLRRFREEPEYDGLRCVSLVNSYMDRAVQYSLEAGAVECLFKTETDALFVARINALTRQIQLQKKADADRHRFESILGSIGEGVYGVDTSGQVTFVNPAARRMLGFNAPSDYVGKQAYQLFQGFEGKRREDVDGMQDELVQAYLSGEELNQHETVFQHREGQKLQVVCTVAPLDYAGCRQGSVVAFRDISDRKRLERRLIWQATRDPLTDLYNRRFFEKALSREVSKVNQGQTDMSALLYIDFDQFKYLNDTAGHDAGDKLLVEASERLRECVRSTDAVARLGGDEFAVILRGVQGSEPLDIAEGLRKSLQEVAYIGEDISFKLSCSVGIATIEKGMTEKDVLSNADIACGIAKRKGRNQSHLYDERSDQAKAAMSEEIVWSTRLTEALETDDFRLLYQPILPLDEVDFENLPEQANRLWASLAHLPDHYEVLIRLRDDGGESISPRMFLPMAERFNLINRIDVWVVEQSLKKLKELHAQGRNASFSVNLSGATLSEGDSLRKIRKLLIDSGVTPSAVIFEITETSAIEKLDGARRFIEDMRKMGWRFSLDDFGTGFSSFSQLKYLPVDIVKIDGQFIQGMADNTIDRAIVTAINEIAHSLGIETIAEYVESPEALRALQEVGIDHAQGYYISKPLLDVKERADSTMQIRFLSEPIADY